MRDVSIPQAAGDPVAVALNDPDIQIRLRNAARAFLGTRGAELTPIQRAAEAEVLVQEAASRAWKRRDHFDGTRDVVKWLVGFVMKVAQEFARNRSRGKTTSTADGSLMADLAVDPSRPVDDVVADKLDAAEMLRQLLPVDQDIVRMKCCEDMTCAEIGERLGMNEDAVRVRFFRAKGKLRQLRGVTGEGQP